MNIISEQIIYKHVLLHKNVAYLLLNKQQTYLTSDSTENWFTIGQYKNSPNEKLLYTQKCKSSENYSQNSCIAVLV